MISESGGIANEWIPCIHVGMLDSRSRSIIITFHVTLNADRFMVLSSLFDF
jgi:hypothetical protein